MKTDFDFIDRVYNILIEGGFGANVDDIYKEPEVSDPGKEFVTITGIGTDTGFDTVDNAFVAVNLIIADDRGATDITRFRYLIPILDGLLENYKDNLNDFVQYGRDNNGGETTNQVNTDNEYFHINPVFNDGAKHDPERQGYSYYTKKIRCWIEK